MMAVAMHVPIRRFATGCLPVLLASVVLLSPTPASGQIVATGGDYTEDIVDGGVPYRAHVFTNTGPHEFNVLVDDLAVEYLIVAGGGGGRDGGALGTGGGGAGGVVLSNGVHAFGPHEIVVGAGGINLAAPDNAGESGGNSSAFGVVAYGGGGGSRAGYDGVGGGSGGGGGAGWVGNYDPGGGGAGTNGQGRAGGGGGIDGSNGAGGGGGGYGAAGGEASGTTPGAGGEGIDMTAWLNGLALGDDGWFAGGGGGGRRTSGTVAAGGKGGGGAGAGHSVRGQDAGLNTGGGGGGGGGENDKEGGAGGSGIVIIRYVVADASPLIANEPVSNVTTTAATMTGFLVSTGEHATTVGVLYGEEDASGSGSWASTNWWAEGAWGEGDFPSVTITDLTSDRTYYYTFTATNAAGVFVADDPVSFITGAVTIQKDADADEDGLEPGTFSVHRPGTATNEALTVGYARNAASTAEENVHYEPLSGTVTIPAGETSAAITVSPLQDLETSEDTTLQLDLLPGNYALGANASATMTILALQMPGGPTNVWLGAGNASDPDNWSLGVPESGHDILLDGLYSTGDMTWDAGVNGLTDTVASWTQTEDYTGTVTIETLYGATGFTNFTVSGNATLEGGAWTHEWNSNAETYRLRVTVGGDLLVTNAVIHADSKGFTAQSSASPGRLASHGGVYGGVAQRGNNQNEADGSFNTNVYGSVTAPVNLGSPGTSTDNPGGGAIMLTVTGTVTVATSGFIRADASSAGGLRGSGGSVYLTSGFLKGGGTIRAHGGSSSWNQGAAGSGGRVAIVLNGEQADFSEWSGATTAFGGLATGGGADAAAGTVYRRAADGTDTLIIDNNNYWPGIGSRPIIYRSRATTLMPPPPNAVDLNAFSQVEIKRRGQLGVGVHTTLDLTTFAPLTYGADASYIALHDDTGVTYPTDWVIDGYTLFANTIAEEKIHDLTIGTTGALSHFQNVNSETHKLNLTIPGDLTIQAGGRINADHRGYAVSGPGWLSNSYGGAHGGTALPGTALSPLPNTRTYGSVMEPVNLGSRGNADSSCGGAIILNVKGTTSISAPGSITVNSQTSHIAGTGGSIQLTTSRLIGDGMLQAHGGNSGWNQGTAGAGGRIAVYLTGEDEDFSAWTGTITAYGGEAHASSLRHAAAGTVYLQTEAQDNGAGTVTVDNTTRAKNETWTTLPAFAESTEDLERTAWVTANNARIGLVTNAAIDRIDINTDGVLDLNGFTLTLKAATLGGEAVGSGVHTAASLDSPFVTDESDPQTGQLVIPPPGSLFLLR